jgi:cytochrome b561
MNDAVRYNAVARALHWSIGLLIIANIALALLGEPLEHVMWIYPLHKAIGMLVLALSVLRLLWRLTYKAPPLPGNMAAWEVLAARLVIAAFYAMIILVPLSGWVMSSAGKWPISFFGLFEVPKFAITKDDPVAHLAHEAHEVLGLLFIPLVAVHVAAALRHHIMLKDNVLLRMTGKPMR